MKKRIFRGVSVCRALGLLIGVGLASGCSAAASDEDESSANAVRTVRLTTEEQVADFDGYFTANIREHFKKGTLGSFQGQANIRINYGSFPVASERGAIVVANGRGSTFLGYAELIYDLNRLGYSVYVIDHRGQGTSQRILTEADEQDRGHVDNFEYYVDDLKTFVDTVVKATPHRAIYALGHSMGGGILTRLEQRYPHTFQSAVLVSPMHRIRYDEKFPFLQGVSVVASWFGFADSQLPGGGEKKFEGNGLTSSLARFTARDRILNETPGVRIGPPTFGWARQAMAASDRMKDDASKFQIPVRIFLATEDRFVANHSSQQLCALFNAAAHDRGEADLCTAKELQGRHDLLVERDATRSALVTEAVEFFK